MANVLIIMDVPAQDESGEALPTGEMWYRRAIVAVSKALAQRLLDERFGVLTLDDPVEMVKIMALRRCTEPSTGSALFATQVAAVTAADAVALLASGDAIASEEPLTKDVGLLARNAGVGKDYPDMGTAYRGVVRA